MLGQRHSPLLVQNRQIVHDAGPTLHQHWVCCILRGSTAALLCWVTLYSPVTKSHYPDNTIHSSNADVMMGHRLWRWANIIPILSLWDLNHEYNRGYIFSKHFLKTIWPSDIKRYIWHDHKDCFSKMSAVFYKRHPSFHKLGHKHYCNKPNRLLAFDRA